MPLAIRDSVIKYRTRVRYARAAMAGVVVKAFYQEMQIEVTEVKELTPVWNPARRVPPGHVPGSLRASVRLEGPFWDGNKVSFKILAGNDVAYYALWVHEDLDAYHATGQAKFIEQPLKQSGPYMPSRVAARVDWSQVFKL